MPKLTAYNLKPRQLRLLNAIAEHGQLQIAAQVVGVSQPGASRMLSEIEDMVGGELFYRNPKGMELTAIGHAMIVRTRTILREMTDLEQEIEAMIAGRSGFVRVGAVTGPALGLLVPAIKKLKREAQDAEVSVEVAPSRHLVHELAAGRLDFALARLLPEFDSRDFDVRPLQDEHVSVLVRRGHDLGSKAPLPIGRLAETEWVMQESGSPIRDAVINAFARAGVAPPSNVVNSSSVFFTAAYVSETDAVAAVTDEVARLLALPTQGSRFERLTVDDPITVSLCYKLKLKRHPLSPVCERLFNMIGS